MIIKGHEEPLVHCSSTTVFEVAELIRVIKKLRHYIEASHHATIIDTDYEVIADIVKQSSSKTMPVVRLNLDSNLTLATSPVSRIKSQMHYSDSLYQRDMQPPHMVYWQGSVSSPWSQV